MPNLTLSIPPELKERMDKHPEINWSQVARGGIQRMLDDLEFLDRVTANSELTEADTLRLGRDLKQRRAGSTMVNLDRQELAMFCQRWRVRELALFGSVLRQDFGAHSDVDVLVMFRPDANWSLLDHARMEEELQVLMGRKVDLVTRRALERSANWIRRDAIFSSAEPVYVEG